jgi:hypothetical protein
MSGYCNRCRFFRLLSAVTCLCGDCTERWIREYRIRKGERDD